MAYNNKYLITMATKSGSVSTLYLLEDGYEGDLIEYPAVNISIQYIPKSDNIFEPIYVSQLNVVIDVTDDMENMPNFSTLNDRKYLAKLFYDEVLEWQGWALSDYVQFGFSTGRKELAFNCIDGLGMLEKTPFILPTDYVISDFNNCLFYILGCLNALKFDTNLNVVTGISLYADGMATRADISSSEPLAQSFMNYGTFVNNQGNVEDCLTILTKIVRSFGARLYQAEAKWYIVCLSQFAQNSYWFTEYSPNGIVADSGQKDLTGQIQGFSSNNSNLFFVDNSQVKILRKGYNRIQFNKNIDYPSNYLTNWDLKKIVDVDQAYAWTATPNAGQLYVWQNPALTFNSFYLEYSLVTAPFEVSVKPSFFPKINYNEIIHLSFDYSTIAIGATIPQAFFLLRVHLQTPSGFYSIDQNKNWEAYGTSYYFEPFDENKLSNSVNFSFPQAPENGTIYFEFIIADAASAYWKSTVQGIQVGNFSFTLEPAFKSYLGVAELSETKEYVLDAEFDLGFNNSVNGSYSYNGFLADSTGLNLKNWFRYEYQTEKFRSLTELVLKQYSNNLNKNVINIDASFMGMNTNNGRFSGAMMLTAADTDPAQINVAAKSYIIGNSTIDLFNDTIQATLLDINKNNVDSVIYEVINSTSNPPFQTGIPHYRSSGYLTSAEAYAATIGTDIIYTEAYLPEPDIGDIFYEFEDLTIPYDGGYLWYKVVTTFPNTKVYQIRIDGVIIGIFT